MSEDVAPWRMWPHYYSTYCIHELHDQCRLKCKTCEAPCRCECHTVEASIPLQEDTSRPNPLEDDPSPAEREWVDRVLAMLDGQTTALVIYTDGDPEPSLRGVDRRNVGVIGAPDSGKTTLVERSVAWPRQHGKNVCAATVWLLMRWWTL